MNQNVDRNEPCPCKSGKSYKKCFLKNSDECVLYQDKLEKDLLDNADEIQGYVSKFFKEVTEDVSTVFTKKETGRYVVSMRAQFIILFTYIDVCASFWDLYHDAKTKSVGTRFKKWVNKYCLVNENKAYTTLNFGRVKDEHLYSLRCSLVHFFGVSLKREHFIKDNVSISLVPDEEARERLEPMIQKSKNRGHSLVTISPKQFVSLLQDGKNLMMRSWIHELESNKDDKQKLIAHIKGMKRIYDQIKLDGAERVYYE